jgi:colanic acid/amylovoran biosynthesis protein
MGALRDVNVLVVSDAGALTVGETYHVGDEAMLRACVECVRRFAPNARITVMSSAPEWTSREYGVRAIERLAVARTADAHGSAARRVVASAACDRDLVLSSGDEEVLAEMASADVVIVAGGGNICSLYPGLLQERLAIAALSRWRATPLVVVSQTIGPSLARADVTAVSRMLAGALVVGVRERFSLAMLDSLGVKAHLQLDDALPLGTPPREPEPYIAVTMHRSQRRLDLGVMAQALDQLACHTGWRLLFVSHFESATPGWNDATLAEQLAARLTSSLEILPILRVQDTIEVTSRASLVVSTRYHPLVFGLGLGVPSVGIVQDAYHHVKLGGALAHAGLPEFAVPATSPCLADRLRDVASRRQEIAASLVACRAKWHTLREAHDIRVRAALLEAVDA